MLKNDDMKTSIGCSISGDRLRRGEPGHHARHDALAALARECKGVAQSEVDLPGERVAQVATRPEKTCSYRRLGNAERSRGLLGRKLFQRTQDEHDAGRLGQRIDFRLEQPPDHAHLGASAAVSHAALDDAARHGVPAMR
jgi:hypothetical protein